jgi:hypothetical protein
VAVSGVELLQERRASAQAEEERATDARHVAAVRKVLAAYPAGIPLAQARALTKLNGDHFTRALALLGDAVIDEFRSSGQGRPTRLLCLSNK